MSTAPQSLIGREAEKSRKNTAKKSTPSSQEPVAEARENRPVVQVRTARSKTATRSINWALFSIQTEWRRNASGFESAATWKMCEIRP